MSTTPTPVPLPILWGVFLMSNVLFLGISLVVPVTPVPDAGWVAALALPAVIAAGLAAEGSVLARLLPQVKAWFLARFALAEAAGVLGLVAYVVSGEHVVQLACAGCGLVAHVLAFPSARALEMHGELPRR